MSDERAKQSPKIRASTLGEYIRESIRETRVRRLPEPKRDTSSGQQGEGEEQEKREETPEK